VSEYNTFYAEGLNDYVYMEKTTENDIVEEIESPRFKNSKKNDMNTDISVPIGHIIRPSRKNSSGTGSKRLKSNSQSDRNIGYDQKTDNKTQPKIQTATIESVSFCLQSDIN